MFFWCVQVDAAAGVEVDGEACRRRPCVRVRSARGRRRSEEARGGNGKDPLVLFIKGKGISDRREN